jgi:hypothetical protein
MLHSNGYHPEPVQEMPAWMREQDDPFVSQPAAKQPAAQATEPALMPDVEPFNFLTLEDLLNLPPKEWIIENVIGAGDLAMVYGLPGTGKTFIVIDLIFAACLGQQFAMRFNVARPLNVAYAVGEGVSGLPMRFAAAAAFYGVDKLTSLTFVDNTPQLFDGKISTTIQAFVGQWQRAQAAGKKDKLDVLVIDTLHTATAGADENSSQDMGIVLAAAKYAARELGCAVILVHHTNKNGTAERGSSSLRGAMDCMIGIERISDNSTKAVLKCEKLKDGEAWKPQTFDLVPSGDTESVRVWWDTPSDAPQGKAQDDARKTIVAFMMSQPGKKFTAKMLAEVAGITQTNTIYHLSRMVSECVCSSALMDTDKQPSSRNPITYFISS